MCIQIVNRESMNIDILGITIQHTPSSSFEHNLIKIQSIWIVVTMMMMMMTVYVNIGLCLINSIIISYVESLSVFKKKNFFIYLVYKCLLSLPILLNWIFSGYIRFSNYRILINSNTFISKNKWKI